MNNINNEYRNEVFDLLPWYVNGTLNQKERAVVDDQARKSPLVRLEVDWLTAFSRQIATRHCQFDEQKLLSTVLTMVRTYEPGEVLHFKRRGSIPPTWHVRAFAVAATLVAAQSITLLVVASQADKSPMTNLAPLGLATRPGGSALLQVTFLPNAKEERIRKTLHAVRADIVSGPGALGVYTVAVPTDSVINSAQFLVSQKDVVERVSSLHLRPANDGDQ